MTPPDPKPIDTERPTDTNELRRLATECARDGDWWPVAAWKDDAAIHRALFSKLTPSSVLALLTELDALRAVEKAARKEYRTFNVLLGMRDRVPTPTVDDLMEIERVENDASLAHAQLWAALDDLARLRTEGTRE